MYQKLLMLHAFPPKLQRQLSLLVRAVKVSLSTVPLPPVANTRQVLLVYSRFCISIIQTSFLYGVAIRENRYTIGLIAMCCSNTLQLH